MKRPVGLNFIYRKKSINEPFFIYPLFRGGEPPVAAAVMLCGQFCLIELCDNFQGLSRRYFTNKQEKICHEAFSFFDSNHDGQVKIWITWELC